MLGALGGEIFFQNLKLPLLDIYNFGAYVTKLKRLITSVMQKITPIIKVVAYRFTADDCFTRASALTYNSLLSLVPLLAVMFGIAKGFGLEKILEHSMMQEMQEQQEIMSRLIGFGYSLLEEIRGGLVAGLGILFLFITILFLLSNVEASLNHMWGQKRGRSIGRKICDYLTLILIGPIVIVISSSVTLFITGIVDNLHTTSTWLAGLHPVTQIFIASIPYVMSFLLFAFLYMFIPNAKVQLKSACIAAVFAGVAYQLLQATYITVQIEMGKMGTIYGSFAALPLFLVWLYLSWMIFLIGAEIVVIHQERLWQYAFFPFRILSQREIGVLSVAITKVSLDAFLKELPPVTVQTLSSTLKLPERLVSELVEGLVSCKVLVHTLGITEQESGFLPTLPPDRLRIGDVIESLQGKYDIESNIPLLVQCEKILAGLSAAQNSSDKNSLLKALF